MATNLMQKRTRQAFLAGLIIATLIGAIIIIDLMNKLKEADEKYKTLESFNSKIYVARTDLTSGQDVTMDNFEMVIVRTTVDKF